MKLYFRVKRFYGVNAISCTTSFRDHLKKKGVISCFLFVPDHWMLRTVLLACSFDVREGGCSASVIPEGQRIFFFWVKPHPAGEALLPMG